MDARQAYRILLRLYPHDYRARFAIEMSSAFALAAEERRRKSGAVCLGFLVGELMDLVIGAGREWVAKTTTDRSLRGRSLPDVRMMRPPGVTRELWFTALCASAGQDEIEKITDRR